MELDPVVRARAATEAIVPLLGTLEQDCRLPPGIVDALVEIGVFKLFTSRALGGAQASPQTMVDVIEALAFVDGSVGWCAMIAATSSLTSAYLDDATAREIYGPRDATTCGVFAPSGRASLAGDGYRVSGRWSFASGCEHSQWRMGGVIAEGDAPLPSGAPDVRCVVFRADETRVHRTWDTVGLRGTGSHDLEVADVVVPRERTFSLLTGRPRADAETLPFFGVLAAGVAAVGLGIARAAVANVSALVQTKKQQGGHKPLAHREVVQLEVATAEARTAAARALLADTLARTVEAVRDSAPDDPAAITARARLRMAACHAATEASAVVRSAYELGGGAAVYRTSPLQRMYRDASVVTHHIMVGSGALAMSGRVLLGVPTDSTLL